MNNLALTYRKKNCVLPFIIKHAMQHERIYTDQEVWKTHNSKDQELPVGNIYFMILKFQGEKFQLIRYRVNQDIKYQSEYKAKSNKTISQTNEVKGLGIVMSDNLTISNHQQI